MSLLTSNFRDVVKFHQQFNLPSANRPSFLDHQTQEYREKFLQEELTEFKDACEARDMKGAADALVDLVYVAMGTAYMMGLPWQNLWDEVQRANMSKVRATSIADSKRGSPLDIVKPHGWRAPDHTPYVGAHDTWPVVQLTPIPHPMDSLGDHYESSHQVSGMGGEASGGGSSGSWDAPSSSSSSYDSGGSSSYDSGSDSSSSSSSSGD